MAFMNQERKKTLAAVLAEIAPKGWKYSLAVRNHSTIVCTITQAPVDLVDEYRKMREACGQGVKNWAEQSGYYCTINDKASGDWFFSPGLNDIMKSIVAALNVGNWDKSDPMTDYFDVGWYVDIRIGAWDTPFLHAVPKVKPTGLTGYYAKKNATKNAKLDAWKIGPYLPANFATLSPGKKAAATKKAKQLAGL